MQNIIILGSTGNLGTLCLQIIEKHLDKFTIVGLTGHSNQALLQKQAQKHQVPADSLTTINLKKADIIVNLLAGIAGIPPTLKAQKLGKKILLANKEALIACPQIKPKNLIPIDSEHNAIYEILKAHPTKNIHTLYLPCSGGPFLGYTKDQLKNVNLKQVLAHPKYKMGKKISIESASLLNKGFEIIEAHRLFNTPISKIKTFLHPECTLHGAVKFTDNTTYAYISKPDMTEHLKNALFDTCDPQKITQIPEPGIIPPDHKTFPGIKAVVTAYQTGQIKQFLQKEEKLIKKLLNQEIQFHDFLHKL